ncbi:MAG: metallophosphoesterase [Bacilli bacterium]|nr:metallophosphoesterase [Bacilli bacterium]
MTKRKEKILELILENESPEIIKKKLKINDETLKKEIQNLKLEGHNIQRQFYYNGKQKYVLQKSVPDNITHIVGVPKNGIFRALATADYHIGSKKQNIQYINRVYEFANDNDINIIFNCGDIVEGLLNTNFHKTHFEQIEYLLENHPHDDNILSFISLGNHDSDLIRTEGLDLHTIINQNRNDLISLGYGPCKINIFNNQIIMCHVASEIKQNHAHLKLTGHGHRYHLDIDNSEPTLYVPTASNNIYDEYPPGFVDMWFNIKDGSFTKATFYLYLFINRKSMIRASCDKYNYETSFPQKQKKLNNVQKNNR